MDIYTVHHPTVQELEACKANCEDEHTMTVLDLKLAATNVTPTPLEQTMSAEQLFEMGSPLWARPYSISELSFIIPMWETISDDLFKTVLGRATDYETLSQNLIDVHMGMFE